MRPLEEQPSEGKVKCAGSACPKRRPPETQAEAIERFYQYIKDNRTRTDLEIFLAGAGFSK